MEAGSDWIAWWQQWELWPVKNPQEERDNRWPPVFSIFSAFSLVFVRVNVKVDTY